MKSSKQKQSMTYWVRCLSVAVIAMGGLLFGPAPAWGQFCIEDVWKLHPDPNTGKLNTQDLTCTANDVTLSQVTNIDITAGGSCQIVNGEKVCTCNVGGDVTFTADFQMTLTAQDRYDTGFYIADDDDGNCSGGSTTCAGDGALTGSCQATEINALNGGNFINLDAPPNCGGKNQPPCQTGDTCGDITGPENTQYNPQIVHYTLTVPCTDSDLNDPNNKLVLDWCTTWRQPGANDVCDGIGNGGSTNDVYPGSPSKCNCGALAIDIFFETADITVVKEALDPGTVDETGGSATYTVAVTNNAQQASVTLDSLEDDKYGDITQIHAANSNCGSLVPVPGVCQAVTFTDCTLATIAAQDTYTCMFTGTVPAGDTGGTFDDIVEACGTDSFDNTDLCDDDDATVTYTDVPQPPTLSKTAEDPTCQVDFPYAVVVTNTSAQDELTLNSLTDDVYGDITSVQGDVISTNCSTPQTIAPSGNYSCTFTGRTTDCDGSVTDTVTGSATDDDGATYDGTSTPPFEDDATVTVTTTP